MNEGGALDTVLVMLVKTALQRGDFVGADVEAAVVVDPVGKRYSANVSHLVLIDLAEDASTIHLDLFLHFGELHIGVRNGVKEFSKSFHDRLLADLLLFGRQVGHGAFAGVLEVCGSRRNRFGEFAKVDRAIVVIVHDVYDQAIKIVEVWVNVELFESFMQLVGVKGAGVV